jgi:hypothetical protein
VQATILASDGALVGGGLPWGYDSFGWAVATDGERVVASAPILGPTGNLYVLTREQGSWAERRRLGPPTGFGVSAIGIDGDDAFLSFAGFMLGPGAVWTVDLLHPAGALVVCDALPNSTGATGRLHYRCSISLERNDLRLRAVDLPPGELAVFFYGALPRHVPFADGFLCIGSPQFRLPPAQVSASGVAQSVVDVLAPPMNAGPGKITAGSTWHFQCWYRDPGGASGTNLTDALRITFCP